MGATIDPDYQHSVPVVPVDLPAPTSDQVLFAQHLLAMLRRVAPSRIYTAGEMLAIMEQHPGAGRSEGQGDKGQGNGEKREEPAASQPLASMKLPRGEAFRRIKAFLFRSSEPQTCRAIADATGLVYQTVFNTLHNGHFERDEIEEKLWRIRTVTPAPLSSSTSHKH